MMPGVAAALAAGSSQSRGVALGSHTVPQWFLN
jgi:hypothetical protein